MFNLKKNESTEGLNLSTRELCIAVQTLYFNNVDPSFAVCSKIVNDFNTLGHTFGKYREKVNIIKTNILKEVLSYFPYQDRNILNNNLELFSLNTLSNTTSNVIRIYENRKLIFSQDLTWNQILFNKNDNSNSTLFGQIDADFKNNIIKNCSTMLSLIKDDNRIQGIDNCNNFDGILSEGVPKDFAYDIGTSGILQNYYPHIKIHINTNTLAMLVHESIINAVYENPILLAESSNSYKLYVIIHHNDETDKINSDIYIIEENSPKKLSTKIISFDELFIAFNLYLALLEKLSTGED